ncbi:MAG: calcium-translocating P-type ATPase, SERCA-type [Candidatus Woesearchaeota archaeon]
MTQKGNNNKSENNNYYTKSPDETIKSLGSSKEGLSENEAQKRLNTYGSNEIKKTKNISPMQIFVRQFTSFIVLILIIAMIISLLVGEKLDAIVIAIIVILNGLFGFVQEYKAEKAIEALKKLTALKAKVIRGGKETEIDSREIVPGDIIVLETGNKVPCDARLIDATLFQVNESSLTGESVPTQKSIETLKKDASVTDQANMIFMSTNITNGHAKAIATATGMDSEIGKIAEMVQDEKEELTPLQEKLKRFGKWLGVVTIGVCAFVFGIGVLREYLTLGMIDASHISEMFLASVALAVAAIPEGLTAIVTISLALGVRRMVKRNALIRRLPAVETLGCTNFICSDKTGTLTKNEMTVKKIFVNNSIIDVSGEGYSPKGEFRTKDKKIVSSKDIELILRIGTLCNDSRLNQDKKKWTVFGDPTEGALIVSARKSGLKKDELDKRFPRIDEIPFDSDRKCMTTIHNIRNKKIAYVKGAPDMILDKCSKIYTNGSVKKLTTRQKHEIFEINKKMASNALRILGFAYRELPKKYKSTSKDIEKDMVFVGLQAMIDPARKEVKDAIEKCRDAGIKTVMITGDHKLTALAIAKELGIFKEGDMALTGDELERLSDKKLKRVVENITIYARVSPEHKARILDTLKKKGHVVAMTGDGVNDAPALKKADIGVSMGITGTDVAKEASDMILTDDHFTSIVNAVEEGRGIYNSIKQFVQYTLSSNLGEILVIFLAILIGWPLPLIAIQILWVNLLTDGLPGLALGLDPFNKDIMKVPPRKRDENIISKDVVINILIVGIVMGFGTLFLFHNYGIETIKAKSVAFTTLVFFQLFNVLTYRAKRFKIDIKDSKYILGSVIISILMQIIVLYTPLNMVFKTVPLGILDWIKIIAVSSSLYIILEIKKIIEEKKRKNTSKY